MPSFKSSPADGKTTAADTDISVRVTPGGSADVGLSLILSNVTTQTGTPQSIEASAKLVKSGGPTIYLADHWAIPAGGAWEVIEGRLNMEEGDELIVFSDEDNSLDALFSHMVYP